ncbi:MAG: YibE/F family protein [Eubacteriales bacterium]
MNVTILLALILLALMVIIGGQRGFLSFMTLCFNFITLLLMFILIKNQYDPIIITVVGCIIISSIILFYINGISKKTVSSLISVVIVVLITLIITNRIGSDANIQGFTYEELDDVSAFSLYIDLNFPKVLVCQILIGLLGAIIDVSISISSTMNEIYKHNPLVTKKKLIHSGINVGRDILGTMVNTLLFAFISGFMTLIMWFDKMNYSFVDILNRKIFSSEVFQIMTSGIGLVLIIPITAYVTSGILFMKKTYH